jgi:phosphatidylglycerophosphate synthase
VEVDAIILAPPRRRERTITGLTLGERGRRVAVRAGVPTERVHVVRTRDELAALGLGARALLVVRALDQVVAAELVEPLAPGEAGTRVAVDDRGARAGALRVDAERAAEVLAALTADLDAPLELAGAVPVTVGPRARHPAGSDAEVRAARRWQWQLVNKPLDAFITRRFWRPVARPLTRLFLHLPLTPNMISVACILASIAGGVVAASPSYPLHVLGFAIYFVAALLDNVDGEVARLRLESSRAGGWIDTIGDDLARLAVIIGVFLHVGANHPELPIAWLTGITLFNALFANALLYWWCIFVGKTYNNQEYASAIGAAPHQAADRRGWKRTIADLGAQAARRDVLDLLVILLAVLGLSWISVIGLTLGQAVGVAIILPIHVKIVRQRRAARLAATS